MKRPLKFLLLATAGLSLTGAILSAQATEVTVYKNPYCGCCTGHVDHLKAHGFEVKVVEVDDVAAVKARHGVTPDLQSCHTAVVAGYVVEGHVPAAAIGKLLEEKPQVTGIALPGMPAGSPGMPGEKTAPLEVVTFGDGVVEPFMSD